MKKYTLDIKKKDNSIRVKFNKKDCKIVALDSLNKAIDDLHAKYIKLSGFNILQEEFPEQYKDWWLEIDEVELIEYGSEIGIKFKSYICVEDHREKFSTPCMLFSAEIFDTNNMSRIEYEALKIYEMDKETLELVYLLKVELELCYNGYEANERLFEKVISE